MIRGYARVIRLAVPFADGKSAATVVSVSLFGRRLPAVVVASRFRRVR